MQNLDTDGTVILTYERPLVCLDIVSFHCAQLTRSIISAHSVNQIVDSANACVSKTA